MSSILFGRGAESDRVAPSHRLAKLRPQLSYMKAVLQSPSYITQDTPTLGLDSLGLAVNQNCAPAVSRVLLHTFPLIFKKKKK